MSTMLGQYIGTFSVSGSDKEVRERQMEAQLEHMRNAQERRPVQLIISAMGVKVILPENNNVFMEHSLKRIWYATCDPDYRQFSFLAREPKTSAEVQYCHAFVTHTADQAEELISLIGEAFKSTYSEQKEKEPKVEQQQQQQQQQQPKKQPTFHELIEQQVLQQQAKFREIEQEAQTALQQTLTQIATPTPFSERAQTRMEERRRQSEDLSAAASTIAARRDWAKHEIQRVKHAQQSPDRGNSNSSNSSTSNSPASNPNRRSEIPTRQSTPKTSPFKRNSVPPQVADLSVKTVWL
ncbi:Sh2 domain-containing protein 5 [Plakobranchus ocellatus]|uniref:Sh2 domain-containing protein 5 n=1 Tax=Plakobranchus ocellatus TaxID=259542 RepID=A0AAV4CR99_9GAST|nr:Sh2 domain-containing protein 5 [Plakobranchus ocellatus]